MLITQSPSAVPSNVMTLCSEGSSDLRAVSLAIWVSSSAKTTWQSESLRMYAVSSSLVEGYTVVVAAPAHMMPRSARIHSYLVPDEMPTRCSAWIPSDNSPAAIRLTSSPACFQVTEVQLSPSG